MPYHHSPPLPTSLLFLGTEPCPVILVNSKTISFEPRNKPMYLGQLIYDKEGKDIQWRRVSLRSSAGKAGQLHAKE